MLLKVPNFLLNLRSVAFSVTSRTNAALAIVVLLSIVSVVAVGPVGAESSSTWEDLERKAEQAFVDGDLEQSRKFWMDALKEAEKGGKSDLLNVATTLNQLNHLFVATEEYGKSYGYLKRALSIRREHLGEYHLLTAETMGNLALVSHKLGHDHEAEELYKESLKIKDKLFGEGSPESVVTMHNLANLYSLHRHYRKAKALYEKVLKLDRAKYGPGHVEVVRDLISLGVNAYRCKKFEEALKHFQEAEKMAGAQKTLYDRELVPVYHYLALSYGSLKRHDPAIRYHKLARKQGEDVHGKHHPANTFAIINLAQITDEMGDAEEAEELYLSALKHEQAREPHDPYLLTETNLELAQYYHRHDLDDQAEQFYRNALKNYDTLSEHKKRQLYELPVAYAELLEKIGKKEEAREISSKYLHLHSPHKDGHFRM